MKRLPEKNYQSQNRSSFIPVLYWSLNCVGFLTAAVGTAFAIVPAFQSQLTFKQPHQMEAKEKQSKVNLQQTTPQISLVSRSKQFLPNPTKLPSFPDTQGQECQVFRCLASSTFETHLEKSHGRAPIQNQISGFHFPSIENLPSPKVSLPKLTQENKTRIPLIPPKNKKLGKQAFPDADVSQPSYPSIFPPPLQIPEKRQTPQVPPNPENAPPPETKKQANPVTEARKTKLSLSDAVFLALANNTEIKNAYLERIAQKQDLAVEEDKFNPDFTPTLSLSLDELGSSGFTTRSAGANLQGNVVVRIPTGGEITFGWTGNAQMSNLNSQDGTRNDNTLNQNLELSLRQPLLRGGGIAVNTASIKIARINEKNNIQTLKATLIDTITSVILAYRDLLRTQERVKIEQLSLQNAQESLKVTQALIEAGRIAPVDIVQNQTDVANRRVSLLAAENELEARRLALLSILDIDKNTNIEADAIPPVKPTSLDLKKLREVALLNQPNYLQSQLTLERNKLNLLLAEDNRRWDLSFNVSMANRMTEQSDARAGLTLSRTLGDLTLQQRFERARVNLLQAENTLKDVRARLDINVQDRIRDVDLSFSQLELARQARQLSERQLDIEQQKLKLGRGQGIFELIRLQNELAQARNNELEATIRYLNSLTNLDQILGTTLQTWQITIEN
jgi:outer membrane protein TolC